MQIKNLKGLAVGLLIGGMAVSLAGCGGDGAGEVHGDWKPVNGIAQVMTNKMVIKDHEIVLEHGTLTKDTKFEEVKIAKDGKHEKISYYSKKGASTPTAEIIVVDKDHIMAMLPGMNNMAAGAFIRSK